MRLFSGQERRIRRTEERQASQVKAYAQQLNSPSSAVDPVPVSQEVDTISETIAALQPGSPLQKIAQGLIYGTHRPLDNVHSLFTTLATTNPRHWQERIVAAWALGRAPLSPKERDAAVGMLLDALEDNQRDRLNRIVQRTLAKTYTGIAAFYLLFGLAVSRNPNPPDDLLAMILCIAAFTFMVTWPVTAWYSRRFRSRVDSLRIAAAESLGRLQAPESVAALAGALFDRNTDVQEAAALALHESLPTLTDTHFGQFGAQSMANLGKSLSHADNLLVYNVLEALAKVGTSHAIPYVERVAREGRTTRLRDRAIEVVEILKERQSRENEAKTLMRPSLPFATAPDTLLRPAQGGNDTEQQQMLRASSFSAQKDNIS